MSISSSVSPTEVDFLAGGPYTVTDGTLSLQSLLTIDAKPNVIAEIDSTISGSGNELILPDTGQLTLGGSVTVAGITGEHGTLTLGTQQNNGTVSITNGDHLTNPTGLTVNNDAIFSGIDPLVLLAPPGYAEPYFDYDSTAGSNASPTSIYSGPISGPGGVEITSTGLLQLASAGNSYQGGTNIESGTVALAIDPSLNAPATLGIGGVGIEAGGVLDLNGCSLTLTSLNAGDASLNGGAINNTLTGPGPRSVGTAVLTLDYNNLSMPCDFAGTIAGKADATDPPIRFVKTGQGELDCDGPACMSIPGGFEIDAGKVVMNLVGPPDGNGGSDGYVPLDMNGGTLDVHGSELFLDQLNGSGGTIEDSDGVGDITLDPGEDINLGGPSVFGGAIDQSLTGGGNGGIGLLLNGPDSFTCTGSISCNVEVDGLLQIGDGQSSQTDGSISGTVDVKTANGLTFDVAAGATETCTAVIESPQSSMYFGSILKIGSGNLRLNPSVANSYTGAMTVEGGILTLGNSGVLAPGTPLIVDDGAAVNLAGNSITTTSGPLSSVTLNDGSIVSEVLRLGVPTPRPATLAALESFNLANGTIGPEVTLGGTASINKRTDGSVTIGETPDVGGGVFDEQGSLTGATTTTLTTLYWEPTSGDTWDTGNTANWSLTPGGASNQMWATGDVAVFDTRYANGVTNVVISGAVSAAGIKINDDGFNIEDPGAGSLSVAGNETLDIIVAQNVAGTISSVITGSGSLTTEGGGTLMLAGQDGYGNYSTYTGGTFVDAGTVQLVGQNALGTYQASLPDSADLTVDDSGEVDLDGENPFSVSSLNSSYAAPGAPDGLVTNSSATPAYMDVAVGGTPGVFAGSVVNGASQVQLNFTGNGGPQGLVETLTGQNSCTGGITSSAAVQIGDGTTNGAITGPVGIGGLIGQENELIFDVAPGTTEVFNGWINSGAASGLGSVVLTGGGVLQLTGDTLWGDTSGNHFGALRVESGTLELGDPTALLTVSTVFVDAGGTLDLNGNSPAIEAPYPLPSWTGFPDVTLDGGSIVNSAQNGATINVEYLLELGAGSFSADLAGTATILKADDPGDTTTFSVLGTVGVGASNGNVDVVGGTLQVDGTLDSPSVFVSANGALAGDGTCADGVFIDPDGTGGTLDMDGNIGPALTINSLTLDAGAAVSEAENTQTNLLETADVTGALTFNAIGTDGVTINFPNYPYLAPFEVLFYYGSLTGYPNLTESNPPGNVVNDPIASAIELAGTSALPSTNVLYWGGGTGAWNATNWLDSPTATTKTTWSDKDIAVFEGAGYGVTLPYGFTATPAQMVFIGNGFSINGDGGIDLPANSSITVTADNTATISSNISSSSPTVQLIANLPGGTLALTYASNTYSGGTLVVGGTLQIAVAGSLGSGSATITLDGGTLATGSTTNLALAAPIELLGPGGTINASNANVELAGQISGAGALMKTGSGTLTLLGANAYSGETEVVAGILNIQDESALGEMVAGLYVESGGTLQLQGGIVVAVAETLYLAGDGAGSIGALDSLSGDNYWSGRIVLDNGTNDTRIDSDADTLFITLGINGVSAGSLLTLGGAGDMSVEGAAGIGGNVGSVTKIGGGTLATAYSTTIHVDGGHWQWDLLAVQPAYSTVVVENGAALDLGGYDATVTGSVTLEDGTIADGTVSAASFLLEIGEISAVLAGSGAVTVDGGAGQTVILSGVNTYTGGTVIESGALGITSDRSLGAVPTTPATNITFGDGTLQWESSFGLAANRNIAIPAGATATFDTQQYTDTVAGKVTGSGDIVKLGSGSLTFSAFPLGFTGQIVSVEGVLLYDHLVSLVPITYSLPIPPGFPAPISLSPISATGPGSSSANLTDAAWNVAAIECADPVLAEGASTLQFDVTFEADVTGLEASDFILTGDDSSGTVSALTGSGSSYVVTVSDVSGTGTLGLIVLYNMTVSYSQQYALSSEFYWDASGTGAGGGSGDFSAADWHVGGTSGPMLTPVNGADFVFPAGTGTVTISGQWTADSLTFQGDGAVLQDTASTDSLEAAGLNVGSGDTLEIDVNLTAGSLENDGSITVDSGASFGFAADAGSSGSVELQSGATLVMGANYGAAVVVDDGGTVAFNCSGTISTTFTLPGAGTAIFDALGNSVTITSLQSDLGGGSYDANNIDGTVTFTDSIGGGTVYLACGGNAVNGTINIHGVTLDTTDSMTLNGTGVVNIGSGATFEVDGSMSVEGGTVNNNGVFNLTGFMELDSGWLVSTAASQTFIQNGGFMLLIYAGSNGTYTAGTTTVESGGELYVYESEWTLDQYGNSGTLVIESGGTVEDVGAMWTDVVNYGYMQIAGGDLQVNDYFENLAGGTLEIDGSLENYGTFDNYGTVHLNYGGTINNYGAFNNVTSGLVWGEDGTINNYGTVDNTGLISASSADFVYNEFGSFTGSAIVYY